MDAAHAPIPVDPASEWSAIDPPRAPRRLAHPRVAVLLLLTWALASLSLVTGMHHADADDLRSAVAHHAVVLPEVQHRRPRAIVRWLEESPHFNGANDSGDDSAGTDFCTAADGTTVECPVREGKGDQAWLVWRSGPLHIGRRWMSLTEAGEALGTRPTENSVLYAISAQDGMRSGITWSLPALASVCACIVVLAGPRPRTGTRWFWFWVLSLPVGLGMLWYVAAECWSRGTPVRRRSGWWGLLIALLGEAVLTAVLQGMGVRQAY